MGYASSQVSSSRPRTDPEVRSGSTRWRTAPSVTARPEASRACEADSVTAWSQDVGHGPATRSVVAASTSVVRGPASTTCSRRDRAPKPFVTASVTWPAISSALSAVANASAVSESIVEWWTRRRAYWDSARTAISAVHESATSCRAARSASVHARGLTSHAETDPTGRPSKSRSGTPR